LSVREFRATLTRLAALDPDILRKLRKTAAVDSNGEVVTIPRLPSVTKASQPPDWSRWSPAEKVEHLLA
jgi:hypothetical protein